MDRPQPPWQQSAKPRKAARKPLTQERIVDAALELLVAEGYDAVSMRRVAQALHTGAASLYVHVANKQELDSLLINRAAREVVIPDPDPDRWQEQTAQVMRDLLMAMRAYPGVARAAIGQIPTGDDALISTERLLGILRAGGLSDQVCAYAVDLIPLYVCSVAYEESVMGAGNWTPADIEKFTSELSDWFGALSADRFPNIVALAGALTAGTGDDRFEFGVQVIVAGIASFTNSRG